MLEYRILGILNLCPMQEPFGFGAELTVFYLFASENCVFILF